MTKSLCARQSLSYAPPSSIQTLVDFWNHSHVMEDQSMIIGERLRVLREEKNLSQGDIEEEDRIAPLLCVPCRKRTYGSSYRDT